MNYHKIAALRNAQALQAYLEKYAISLPFESTLEPAPQSPLAQPLQVGALTFRNRIVALPMEGWDGTPDGHPSDLTRERWRKFGLSGAKLVWGGEAVAVRQDGRANPNQLVIRPDTVAELSELRQLLLTTHRDRYGSGDDPLIGLQLTHSGRYAVPNGWGQREPWVAYDHPLLNPRVSLPAHSERVVSDGWLDDLVEDFIQAAKLAQAAGFQFVDVKHCHGYLGHELLSAVDRPGKYGGSLENRTRFVREVVRGIRLAAPGLEIGVRLSAFDFIPFHKGPDGVGVPDTNRWQGHYPYAFGGDGTGLGIDLSEPAAFLHILADLGVRLVCVTGGSPYYNPHIQRPAYYPPSDGYFPPEDPLCGVARQIAVTARLKQACPETVLVGSAYSCLQEWLPNVAQAAVRQGMVDMVGLGRMLLPYPEMIADILAGQVLQRKRICRTFSDCTTAPRSGFVSGCYPLDALYKDSPSAARLEEVKRAL